MKSPDRWHTLSDIKDNSAVCLICGPVNTRIEGKRPRCLNYLKEKNELLKQKNKEIRAAKREAEGKPPLHFITEVNEENRTAICRVCGPVSVTLGYIVKGKTYWKCRTQSKKYENNRVQEHGLTRGEARNAIKRVRYCQNSGCGNLLRSGTGGGAVDHDPMTGRIRGMLCAPCNKSLGLLQDNSNRILGLNEYLLNPPGDPR